MKQEKKKPAVPELPPSRQPAHQQTKKLVACVVDTRRDAIKIAPVIKSLKGQKDYFDVRVVLTGQHPQAEHILARDFEIQPDQNLKSPRAGSSFDDLMGGTGLEGEGRQELPDLLLIQGDTTSAFSAAMAAFHRKIPVGHIEAGLCGPSELDVWPDALNRRRVGALASLHFAPTRLARANLLKEGVSEERIALTGSTVVDALHRMITINGRKPRELPDGVPDDGRRLLVATLDGRTSSDGEIADICHALRRLIDRFEDSRLVVTLPDDPRVTQLVTENLGRSDRIHPIPVLPFGRFVQLVAQSHMLLTDSKGIQEVAPTLRIPTLALSDASERAEAIESRHVKLVGRHPAAILTIASTLLADRAAYDQMRTGVNPFGDGHAAARIALALRRYFEGEAPLLNEEEAFDATQRRLTAGDPAFAAERFVRSEDAEAYLDRGSPAAQVDAIRKYLAEYHGNHAA